MAQFTSGVRTEIQRACFSLQGCTPQPCLQHGENQGLVWGD